MPSTKKVVSISLTRANAYALAAVAAAKNMTIENIISLCLKGSTNPPRTK